MRFNVETGESEIYATGLRNPYDLAFHPLTGDLFATDNGRDDLGMNEPHEELNHVLQGGDYGFPDCWNAGNQVGCENSILAVAFFEAHSSANGLDFYNGEHFPAEFRGNAFVSIFGSWVKPGVQTGIQRVILKKIMGNISGLPIGSLSFPKASCHYQSYSASMRLYTWVTISTIQSIASVMGFRNRAFH
jgi:glucose/arabinose dehydrogenase